MATRRPLVLVSGRVRELPAGDSSVPGPGQAGTYVQATDPALGGASSPYIWYRTDPETGAVIDILKG